MSDFQKRNNPSPWRLLTLWAAAAMVLFSGGCKDDETAATPETDSGTESACPWDDNDDRAHAEAVAAGSEITGHMCPLADEDWYGFQIPAGQNLVTITLGLADVTPLNLVYYIWDSTATSVVASLDATQAVVGESQLSITFYLSPGAYYLQIRDSGSDAQDVSHPYQLQILTAAEKDVQEPNNSQASAKAVTAGAMTGYISYDGDEDWYWVAGNARGILQVHLVMPVSGVAPAFRILNANGEVLASGENETGTKTATDIVYDLAIDSAEAWYVVILAKETEGHDAAVPYTLQVSVVADPDVNENNDHSETATALGTATCGAAWSDWMTAAGYIASKGDVDWYRVQASSCDRSVVEVDLAFNAPEALPAGFLSSVSLVREVAGATCEIDQDCQLLPVQCGNDLSCGYFGNSCLSQGVCGGAGICLPTGNCAAHWAIFTAEENARGTVHFAAPLQNWSATGDFYIAVSDRSGESYSVSVPYTLRSRVMNDLDRNEVTGAYSTRPPSEDDDISNHMAAAREVPVHDCTQTTSGGGDTDSDTSTSVSTDTSEDAATETDTSTDAQNDTGNDITAPSLIPGCCGENDWIEGYLSYTYDEDWYAYAHPCPGEDCMVRIVYDIGAGPVDTYVQIFQQGASWYDNLASVSEAANQSAISGSFGGVNAEKCFYAFDGHVGDPFWYFISVRDTIFVNEQNTDGGIWDWSGDQRYRFCVEKVAAGCQKPCVTASNGECDAP